MHVGDVIISGSYYGRVKAMFNERGQKVQEAGPSTPVSILGLNGAPAAGEKFNVMTDEKEAKSIANRREQLIRIQGIKTQKHLTLEEIGRRIAIGNFKELNIIVKGDVDGSVEALSDSLIKLSTEEVRSARERDPQGRGCHLRERRPAGRGLRRRDHRLPGPSFRRSPPLRREGRHRNPPLLRHLRLYQRSQGRYRGYARAGEEGPPPRSSRPSRFPRSAPSPAARSRKASSRPRPRCA